MAKVEIKPEALWTDFIRTLLVDNRNANSIMLEPNIIICEVIKLEVQRMMFSAGWA